MKMYFFYYTLVSISYMYIYCIHVHNVHVFLFLQHQKQELVKIRNEFLPLLLKCSNHIGLLLPSFVASDEQNIKVKFLLAYAIYVVIINLDEELFTELVS